MVVLPGMKRLFQGCAFAGVLGVLLITGCEGGGSGDSPVDASGTVVCLGDSITAGGYPGYLGDMLSDRAVVNAGRSGERSGGGDGRAGQVLSRYDPEVLCVLYGINDLAADISAAIVISNLKSIWQTARDQNVRPIAATLTPVSGPYAGLQESVNALNRDIRATAGQMDIPVADLASAFGSDSAGFFPDGLHPNNEGARIIAAIFADYLE
jgi:lysophospholipase L1-like esterase